MGLFKTNSDWIHPTRIIDSYEIIYVLEVSFDIIEEDISYHLEPHNLLILSPHIQHRGFKKTNQPINFFWLHFYCENFNSLELQKLYADQVFKNEMLIFSRFVNLFKF